MATRSINPALLTDFVDLTLELHQDLPKGAKALPRGTLGKLQSAAGGQSETFNAASQRRLLKLHRAGGKWDKGESAFISRYFPSEAELLEAAARNSVDDLDEMADKISRLSSEIEKNLPAPQTPADALFLKAVLQGTRFFLSQLREWSRGELCSHTGGVSYHQVAVALYNHAEEAVFSTCIEKYLGEWDSEFGEALLRAHSNSAADVTRVFLFEREEQIDSNAIAIMSRQQIEYGIYVRVLVAKHHPDYELPPGASTDFTIVDGGKIIGVTEWRGGVIGARWHFSNESTRGLYLDSEQVLLRASQPLDRFLEEGS